MRRKGVPCACDPCKGKNSIRAINNVSPDPNGDFNIIAGTGIAISEGPDNKITIINSANPNAFVEGDNIDLIPSGDDIEIALTQNPIINGTLTVNGDIIQNGAAYETHAEKVYSEDDYIIMRDGAVAGLGAGDFSGFQVKKYDGTNDGRLVIDNSGTARVGDVGDEQPLLTREESANLTDGALLKWDAANSKAVDEGTVGDDTHPVKSVNGVLTPVTNPLIVNDSTYNTQSSISITAYVIQHGLAPVTISETGKYLVIVNTAYTVGTNSYARMGVSKNGSLLRDLVNNTLGSGTYYSSGSMIASFNVGDIVGVSFISGVGGTLQADTSIVRLS